MRRAGLCHCDPDTALNNSFRDGVAGEAGDVMDIQLTHEMLPVLIHGFEAYAQLCGDLFVGLAFGNQLEHLDLARAEAVVLLLEFPSSIERFLVASAHPLGHG